MCGCTRALLVVCSSARMFHLTAAESLGKRASGGPCRGRNTLRKLYDAMRSIGGGAFAAAAPLKVVKHRNPVVTLLWGTMVIRCTVI